MNKATAIGDSGTNVDEKPKTIPKIVKPTATAATEKKLPTDNAPVAAIPSNNVTKVTETTAPAEKIKAVVPKVASKPTTITTSNTIESDTITNKDVKKVTVVKTKKPIETDTAEKANLPKAVVATKPKSTTTSSSTSTPTKVSPLDPLAVATAAAAAANNNDPTLSSLLSPLSEYSSNSRNGNKSARLDGGGMTPNSNNRNNLMNGGGYNTGRISEEEDSVGGTGADSTTSNNDDNMNDQEIKKALLSRSWKTINSQDRGHTIYWSDIYFPENNNSNSNNSNSNNNNSSSSHRDSEGVLQVKTLKPSFDVTSATTHSNAVTPNSSNKSTADNTTTTSTTTTQQPPAVSVTLTNTPRSSNSDIIIGKGTFGVVIKGVWRKPISVSLTSTKIRHNPQLVSNSSTDNMSPRHKTNNNETFHYEDIEVAIKVLTISTSTAAGASATAVHSQIEFESLRYRSFKEAAIMIMAKKKIKSTEHIIDAYGIIEGTLPSHIANLLRLPEGERCICLVTRYEGGGSLHSLIVNKNKARIMISTREKLRLLLAVIKGLHELHTAGIIHADIKPENVLLSTEQPPMIRLADFGLSMLRDMEEVNRTSLIEALGSGGVAAVTLSSEGSSSSDNHQPQQLSPTQHHHSGGGDGGNLWLSTLASTTRTQGTMTYCAPEMLVNPYQITMNVDELSTVAKASRRTDIYAFAMLCWQLLSQRRPFAEVQGEVMLCSQVHQDYRPPLSKLPKDTPQAVIVMIRCCWDKDRSKRLTSSECCEILTASYQALLTASNNQQNTSPSGGTNNNNNNNNNNSDKSNSNTSTPSRPGSMNLRGGLVNFGGLVVPLPTFDRPKSSARSSLNYSNSSSNNANGLNNSSGVNSSGRSKTFRSDSMNSDTNDSMQTMTLDYATVRNMMNVHVGRGFYNNNNNRSSNVSAHSDSASDSESNSHTGDLASFYSDTDDDDGFHTPAGGNTGTNSPTHHHNRRSGTFGAVLGGSRHYSPDQLQQQSHLSQSQQSVDFLEGRDSTMMLNPLTQRPLSGVSQLTRVSGATGSMDSTFSSHSSGGGGNVPSTRSSVSNNSRNSVNVTGDIGNNNNSNNNNNNNSPPHNPSPLIAVNSAPRTINTTISGMRSSPKALSSSGGGKTAAVGTTTLIYPSSNSILHTTKEHGNSSSNNNNNTTTASATTVAGAHSPSGNSTARSMTSFSVVGVTGGAVSGASTARSVINNNTNNNTAPSTARSEDSGTSALSNSSNNNNNNNNQQQQQQQNNKMSNLSRQLSDRLLGLRVSTTGGSSSDIHSSRGNSSHNITDASTDGTMRNIQRHSSQSQSYSSSSSSSPSKKSMLQKSAEFIMHGLSVSSSLHSSLSSAHNSKQPTEQEQIMLAVLAETEQKQHESERIQHLNQMKQTLTKKDSTVLLKNNHNASFRMRKGSEVVLRSGSSGNSSPTRSSAGSTTSTTTAEAVTAALGVDSELTSSTISNANTKSTSTSINTTLKTLPSIEESTAIGSELATPRDQPVKQPVTSSATKTQSRTTSPAKTHSPVTPIAKSSSSNSIIINPGVTTTKY